VGIIVLGLMIMLILACSSLPSLVAVIIVVPALDMVSSPMFVSPKLATLGVLEAKVTAPSGLTPPWASMFWLATP